MLTAGGRTPPFGDLANCATAAGADAGTGVQRANSFAGGRRTRRHPLAQSTYLPYRKVTVGGTRHDPLRPELRDVLAGKLWSPERQVLQSQSGLADILTGKQLRLQCAQL